MSTARFKAWTWNNTLAWQLSSRLWPCHLYRKERFMLGWHWEILDIAQEAYQLRSMLNTIIGLRSWLWLKFLANWISTYCLFVRHYSSRNISMWAIAYLALGSVWLQSFPKKKRDRGHGGGSTNITGTWLTRFSFNHQYVMLLRFVE